MTNDEFLEKLLKNNSHYRNGEFKVIGEVSNSKVLTTNKYGECLSRIYDLLNGYNISIETALNKDKYFMNVFKDKNEYLYSQLKKLSNYTKSNHKILWEYKYGTVAISPSEIIDKKKISIHSAVNMTEFYLNQVKEVRKDWDIIDYKDLIIKDFSEKGIFTCKIHNIKYNQALHSHKNGNQGCVKCAKNITFYNDETINFFKDIYGKFYIVRLFNETETFYKVGITGVKGNKRKRDLKRNYGVETIYEEELHLKEAYYKEKYFLELFKDYSYKPLIDFKGKTECFSINPYELYKCIQNFSEENKIKNDKLLCEEYGINYEQQFNSYKR